MNTLKPTRTIKSVVLASAAVVIMTGAHALPKLGEVEVVNEGLRSVAIAGEIRDNCGSINARLMRAVSFLRSIENYAEAQGYSSTEIDDFVSDKIEKNRIKAEAASYLAERGVVSGDEASYCALGRDEISAESAIGNLLRSR